MVGGRGGKKIGEVWIFLPWTYQNFFSLKKKREKKRVENAHDLNGQKSPCAKCSRFCSLPVCIFLFILFFSPLIFVSLTLCYTICPMFFHLLWFSSFLIPLIRFFFFFFGHLFLFLWYTICVSFFFSLFFFFLYFLILFFFHLPLACSLYKKIKYFFLSIHNFFNKESVAFCFI